MWAFIPTAPTPEQLDEQEQVFLDDMFALLQVIPFHVHNKPAGSCLHSSWQTKAIN